MSFLRECLSQALLGFGPNPRDVKRPGMLPRKPRFVRAHTQRCESFRPTSAADSFQNRPRLKYPSHSCPDGRFVVRLRDPFLSVAAFSLPEVAPKCRVTLPESRAHRHR